MKALRESGLLILLILILLSTLVITGCNNFSLSFSLARELDGEYLGALDISPLDAVVSVGKKITLSVSGGLKPYKYSAENGTIDENGVYTAPSSSAADVITVEDAYGETVSSTVQVIDELKVLPESDVVDAGADDTFYILGGLTPYTVSSSKGSVQLNNENEVDFTAQSSVSGNETDTVIITDSLGNTATITVLVHDGVSLYIDPPAATINIGDPITLTAKKGAVPYNDFAIISGKGTLNPATNPATFTATVAAVVIIQVTDFLGANAQSVITVNSPDPLSLDPASAAVKIGDTIPFTASGGVLPYTFEVVSGSGTIDSETGIYTAVKQGNDRVEVTDSQGTTVTVNVSVKKN